MKKHSIIPRYNIFKMFLVFYIIKDTDLWMEAAEKATRNLATTGQLLYCTRTKTQGEVSKLLVMTYFSWFISHEGYQKVLILFYMDELSKCNIF